MAGGGERHGRGWPALVQLAHVLLEVEVAAEALATDLARERLLVVVGVHVEREVVDLVEGLVADVALVRLFAAVRELVVLVVALLVEALPAELADEGLVACVDARVRVERGAAVEGLAARVTLVWLLRRVDDFVATKRRRLAEAFAAGLAHEGPCARVHGHVPRQVVVRVEHLSALGAREALLFGSGRGGGDCCCGGGPRSLRGGRRRLCRAGRPRAARECGVVERGRQRGRHVLAEGGRVGPRVGLHDPRDAEGQRPWRLLAAHRHALPTKASH